jgi:hypothetical protein
MVPILARNFNIMYLLWICSRFGAISYTAKERHQPNASFTYLTLQMFFLGFSTDSIHNTVATEKKLYLFGLKKNHPAKC